LAKQKSSHERGGGTPSPPELRSVFGRNLRLLIAGAGSVSSVCNRLGINRTQFNRYLGGEAFPRPDVLHRICLFFGVDGRILLEPLSEIRKDQRFQSAVQLQEIAFHVGGRPFDHYLLPDGLYRFWRRSFSESGKFILGIARIYTENGAKLYKSFDIYREPLRAGTKRHARKHPNRGVLMQHFDGFSVMVGSDSDHALSFTFFEYGLQGNGRYFDGITILTRRQMPGVQRASVVVLERIPQAEILWTARNAGIQDGEEVPVMVRKAIERLDAPF
jgi:transcriptional regulator with XRE-family HTH domain